MSTTQAKSYLLGGASQTVGASATDTPVSAPFNITARSSLEGLRVDLAVSSATATTGITAKLQHSYDGGTTWDDVDATIAKVAVTTTASALRFSIPLNARDSTDSPVFPLRPLGRVVVSSGLSDTVTITDVRVTQAD